MHTTIEKNFHKMIKAAQDIFFDENLPAEIREVSELKAYGMSFDSDIEKKSFILAILQASLEELVETPQKEHINGNIRLI